MLSPRLQYPPQVVVPAAIQALTPTTLPLSLLTRTTVFGYKLNRGYHITVNITIALLFLSNLYCHVTVIKRLINYRSEIVYSTLTAGLSYSSTFCIFLSFNPLL
jgi:uncharacterized membrane protein